MQARRLAVEGAVEFSPKIFPDQRGLFVSPYQEHAFIETVGRSFPVAQTNHSRSRRGVLRGIHFTSIPPGCMKYMYCAQGRCLDIVVDIRVGSPTFGQWDTVELDPTSFRAMYLAEGLGHAFVALEDDTVLSYLCSAPYDPSTEMGIDPLDPEVGLPIPSDLDLIMSDRDKGAPSLAEALEKGILPDYEECQAKFALPKG